MFQILWDTRGYFFWLLVISALCLVLERLWPWRREQRVLRRGFAQDLFALVGHTSLWLAIAADTGATLLVVANALFLHQEPATQRNRRVGRTLAARLPPHRRASALHPGH